MMFPAITELMKMTRNLVLSCTGRLVHWKSQSCGHEEGRSATLRWMSTSQCTYTVGCDKFLSISDVQGQ